MSTDQAEGQDNQQTEDSNANGEDLEAIRIAAEKTAAAGTVKASPEKDRSPDKAPGEPTCTVHFTDGEIQALMVMIDRSLKTIGLNEVEIHAHMKKKISDPYNAQLVPALNALRSAGQGNNSQN